VVNDQVRGRAITFIPQDPFSSFNPVFTVGTQIMDLMKWKSPRLTRGDGSRPRGRWPALLRGYPRERYRADRDAVLEILRAAQIPEPSRALTRLPHEFSGGQRQRFMIAMALLPPVPPALRLRHRGVPLRPAGAGEPRGRPPRALLPSDRRR